MKREIKFRGWDNLNKKMYEVFSFCKDYIKIVTENIGDGVSKYDIERFEIMQYTGLKDKHGKEIYEGDIVRIVTGYEYVVELTWYSLGYSKAYGYSYEPNCIVIGNIYENPRNQ